MSNVKLGKIIERILGKKDKDEKKGGEKPSGQPIDFLSTYHSTPPRTPVRPEKIYIKAQVLQSLEDLDSIKNEVNAGNILIIRLGPLAEKSTEDVKKAVSELCDFTQQIGGDIARLGEERVVVTPPSVEIWRERTT